MQNMRWRIILPLAFSLLIFETAWAASFRCGTKLVLAGDPVSRLLKNCGEPRFKFKARENLGQRSDGTATSVTNWVYSRDRKRDVVVSVNGGRVVKIAYD